MNSKTQQTEIKEPILANAIVEYMDYCKADYEARWNTVSPNSAGGQYSMRAHPGQKYIRLTSRIDYNGQPDGQVSCHSFIVKRDFVTSTGLDLKQGDILMAASYDQPALNKVRGNVLQRKYGKSSWTGTGYL